MTVPSILTLDPGNSTGWIFRDTEGHIEGGTIPQDHLAVAALITNKHPDVVVYEGFKLYPGKAQSLVWNSFYPCEVIGVIKYVATTLGLRLVEQAPSVKKYAGRFDKRWSDFAQSRAFTEHTKDAYQHLMYYERNKER